MDYIDIHDILSFIGRFFITVITYAVFIIISSEAFADWMITLIK